MRAEYLRKVMAFDRWPALVAIAAFVPLVPLAGQRHVVVQLLGGGYSHLADLNQAGTADFTTGFNVSGAVGVQLSTLLSVHGDLTFAHNQARGGAPYPGSDVHRIFYGAHVELRFPFGGGLAPFLFAGGGAVTVTPTGTSPSPFIVAPDGIVTSGSYVLTRIATFTKAAAMLGAGFASPLPRSRFAVLLEAKGLVYRWDRGGFDRTQVDVTYSAGLQYRF